MNELKMRGFILPLVLVLFFSPLFAAKPRPRVLHPAKILRGLKAAVRNIDVRRLRKIPPGKIPGFAARRRVVPKFERKFHLVKKGDYDPVVQRRMPSRLMPNPLTIFSGLDLNNWGAGWPPDTNGDVGRSNVGAQNKGYYIQTVNTSIGIFDKSDGTQVAAFKFDDFFDGTNTPCDNNNNGDPVVLYDRYLDRWIITDFAWTNQNDPYECFAMSKSNDPVSGGWYMWGVKFNDYSGTNTPNVFNDYPKMGVWDDGYYVTFNDFTSSLIGVTVWALDKNSMSNGNMNLVAFFLDKNNDPYAASLLPANSKGPSLPPSGAPNYLVSIGDDAWSGINHDSIAVYKCDVDWSNPSGATLTGPTVVNTAAFDSNMCGYSRNCIPQKDTNVGLDSLSDRAMYSAFYWNYGNHETIVFVHTVDADGSDHAGVRWYELRDPGGTPTIYQQGTYAPDSNHRWLGSGACDSNGNIAIGFSISSSDMYPGVRYAGRKASDPLGELTQGEETIQDGGGSQTNSYNRWGDYSMLTIDPDDNLTFWYTTEYMAVTASWDWHTRIGAFKFAPPGDNPPNVSITNPHNGDTVSGTVTITADASDDNGVDRVEFYIDGVLKHTDNTAPYSYDWDSTTVGDGNHTIEAKAYDTANQVGTDQITVTTDNGIHPMLVVDLDGNKNSCTDIRDELQNKGYAVNYVTSMPSSIDTTTPATWVCLGIYSNNHQLTNSEGDTLKAYLDAGGKVYMEGGDTWCWDTSTSVHPYFGTWLKGASGCDDGSGDLATINGLSGTFTDGMSWNYNGDNNWIDHIGSNASDSFNIWDNSSPSYHTGVARDNTGAGYKTIAASHEFGGASSGDQSDIMDKYIEFFFGGGGPDNPPTVSFTYPHDGNAIYSVIRVRSHAEDDIGVDKVEFYLDDVLQSTYNCGGATTCDAVWTWDSTTTSVGNHTLKTIAYDTSSQTADETITVNVHPGYGGHFGGPNDDFGEGIAINNDKLYLVGYTYSYGPNVPNILLYRLGVNGALDMRADYNDGHNEYGYKVAVGSGGEIYIVGYTYDGSQNDILVKKLNSDLSVAWTKTLGGSSGDDNGYDIAIDGSGYVYVVGTTETYTYGSTDAILYKLNSADGSVVWRRHYGGGGTEEGRGIAIDGSNNIYIVGYTSSFTYGGRDAAIWKIDSNGARLWAKHFGGSNYEEAYGVAVSGGSVYLVGWTSTFTNGGNDIYVLKLNANNGARQAGMHFGGSNNDVAKSVAVDGSGNVIVVGNTESFGHGGLDIAVYSLNSNLAKNWARTLGGSNSEVGEDVVVDSSGNIYIVGNTNTYTYGGHDFVLYKLNSSGVKMPISSGR